MNKKLAYFKKYQHADYRLLSQMDILCTEAIYSCIYYEDLNSYEGDLNRNLYVKNWFISTTTAHYDNAIKIWNMLFGSWKGEPTHYTKLLSHPSIKGKLNIILNPPPITKRTLKTDLLRDIDMNEAEYTQFHSKTLKYRNQHLVHREHSPERIKDGDLHYPALLPIKNCLMWLIYMNKLIFDKYFDENGILGEYCYEYIDFNSRSILDTICTDHIKKMNEVFSLHKSLDSCLSIALRK